MTTNVPVPVFTPTGFVAPAESDVLAGVQEDINVAFGGNLNFGTTEGSVTNPTPQGQLAASEAAIIGNVNDTFLFYSTQTDPAFAEGRMQDAIGRIYFMERIPSLPTTLQIQCVGAVNTLIPAGSQVVDPGDNVYVCLLAGTIGVAGSVTLSFAAAIPGALSVPASVTIFQAIPGWDTATIISGVQGQNVESRAAFEQRRALSTAANSAGSLPSVLGAVLGVPGVLQAFVFENSGGSPTTQSGVTLPAHSLYVAAYGGAPADVARAIWTRKAPGCGYASGNVTVQIQDTSPGYVPPFPTYSVTYQIPNPLPLLFSVQIVNSAGIPADATTQIRNAIIAAGAGNPNALNVVDGPAATIGAKIWASRFIPPVSALGTWAEGQVIQLQIGANSDPDAASAFGYCQGTSLSVTSVLSGSLGAGQTLSVSNGSGVIIPGTTIVSQVTGSVGGTGVYTISTLQMFGQTNIIVRSNAFNLSWGTVNSTVTGSAGTSPDGTNNGWQWQRSGTASAYLFQGITTKPPSNLTYTFSIYAKAGTGNYLAIALTDGPGSGFALATFNVATGAISVPASIIGTFSNAVAAISPAPNGWWRCSITAVCSTDPTLTCAFSGNSTNVSLFNSPDPLSSTTVFVFGAQVEGGPVPQTYIPTAGSIVTNSLIGFATPNQNSVQVRLDQIPNIAAQNVAVSYI